MSDELSDEEKLKLVEGVVDDAIENKRAEEAAEAAKTGSDEAEVGNTNPAPEAEEQTDPVTQAFEQILFLLAEASRQNADMAKFRRDVTAPLLVVANAKRDVDLAKIVSAQVANKQFRPSAAQFCLVGLAQRSPAGKRMYQAKQQMDIDALRHQVEEYLTGKREWSAVVPQAKAEAVKPAETPDAEPDSHTESDAPKEDAKLGQIDEAKKPVFDWQAAEADMSSEIRDPSWRPDITPSGNARRDSLLADLALIESWD